MKRTFFQLVRFGFFGGLNLGLDALIYTILTRTLDYFGEHFLQAAFISFVVSSASSFYCNRRWTFPDAPAFSHRQLAAFYVVAMIALTVNQSVLWGLVQVGLFDILAKILASMTAGLVNFSLQKLWVFRPAHTPEEAAERHDPTL